MRRRRTPYRSPDGLDWRDPSMPGFELSQSRGMFVLSPEDKTDLARRRLNILGPPPWHLDPTYNLRKKP